MMVSCIFTRAGTNKHFVETHKQTKEEQQTTNTHNKRASEQANERTHKLTQKQFEFVHDVEMKYTRKEINRFAILKQTLLIRPTI